MQTKEWTTIDKSQWGNGPWLKEPDKKQWTDEETGLPCLVVRNPQLGHLCGYVGVDANHSLYQKPYMHVYEEDMDIKVHGGLTYSDYCIAGDESIGICHKPDEGEPDNVWWLGFDCAHSGDFSPSMKEFIERHGLSFPGVYRDIQYVETQCKELAKQLAAVA